jgi:cyclic pyranopterin phosphate synthase
MLRDNFRRSIDYMRISVTDRCNLRCVYCMPSAGVKPIEHRDILRYEEIARVLRVAACTGVKKIRITGGEPLVRKNIACLVKLIKNIKGIEDLSMTTNGVFLEHLAGELADAGLDRINISLDSLRPGRYREITRGGDIHAVLRGIGAAEKAGLLPVKINMVPIRGLNDDEIEDVARLTLNFPYQVRFIEFMPFGPENMWGPEKFISAEEIKSVAGNLGTLFPAKLRKSGPARYYRFEGAAGVLGFISPLSNHFCGECNRLRLTADGKLRPCLFSETEIDLKPALRNDAPDMEIERLIKLSVEVKPKGHTIEIHKPGTGYHRKNTLSSLKRPMSRIGG